jgi:hypothetical protein
MEYGVYPELIHGLRNAGHQLQVEHIMRRAISYLKKSKPELVIAEFYHEPAFRDRVSNLESMLAHIQRKLPDTRTVVIFDPKDELYLAQVIERFPVTEKIPHPVSIEQLLKIIIK